MNLTRSCLCGFARKYHRFDRFHKSDNDKYDNDKDDNDNGYDLVGSLKLQVSFAKEPYKTDER